MCPESQSCRQPKQKGGGTEKTMKKQVASVYLFAVGSRQSVVVISGTSNYYAQRAYATMIYGHRTEEVALRRK